MLDAAGQDVEERQSNRLSDHIDLDVIEIGFLYDFQVVTAVTLSLSMIGVNTHRQQPNLKRASGNAPTMPKRGKQPERGGQQCWLTRDIYPIINSHVCLMCLKRINSESSRSICL